jgi:hypothetical protein
MRRSETHTDFHVLAIAAGEGKLLVVCFGHFEDLE